MAQTRFRDSRWATAPCARCCPTNVYSWTHVSARGGGSARVGGPTPLLPGLGSLLQPAAIRQGQPRSIRCLCRAQHLARNAARPAGLAEAPAPSGLDLEGPRYERPTYLSVPISYCLYFNSNCTGLEAANYFCANVTTSLLGTSYTAAVDFSAPVPVPPDADPRAVSTVSPAFNITCSSHYADCSTFEWITCA